MIRKLLMLSLTLGLLAALPLTAQPTTATDPKIEASLLEAKVKGLDREALKTELDAWKKLIQTKEEALVRLAATRDAAEGDERSKAVATIKGTKSERNELVERFELILEVYRTKLGAKAGEDESLREYQLYLEGLGSYLDVSDPLGLLGHAWEWLTSWEGGLRWVLRIVAFFVILLAARIVANIVGRIIRRGLDHAPKLDASDLLKNFFVNTAKRVIVFLGLAIALSQIGVDIGPLLAGIGVLGFVVGFALQGTLSNFASGIMILLYRPYDIGDTVKAAGVTGVVEAMTLVSTTMKTFDNQVVIVPNSSIWGDVITNVTARDTRRVDMKFGISYEDDVDKAEKILREIVTEHPMVLDDPEPTIKLHELADSSVNFIVRPWAKTKEMWTVHWDVTREVKRRFDAEGISIPYPQRTVHVLQQPSPES